MPERQQLIADLSDERDVGVLLVAQMGGVPNELQLIIQTAVIDEGGLREKSAYIVRALGVDEHRLSLGLFGTLFFTHQHPILLHHNEPRVEVHFSGQPADINALMIDITQAHASTFGPWRELAADLNRERPLADLLSAGAGHLATLPRPAAERVANVLAHHGLSSRLVGGDTQTTTDEHSRSTQYQMIGVGDSYVVALDFSVERMRGRQAGTPDV